MKKYSVDLASLGMGGLPWDGEQDGEAQELGETKTELRERGRLLGRRDWRPSHGKAQAGPQTEERITGQHRRGPRSQGREPGSWFGGHSPHAGGLSWMGRSCPRGCAWHVSPEESAVTLAKHGRSRN